MSMRGMVQTDPAQGKDAGGLPATPRPAVGPCGRASTRTQSLDQDDEPVHIGLQECTGIGVGDLAVGADEIGLELDVGLTTEHHRAQDAEDLPQVLLADRRADRAGVVPVIAVGLSRQTFLSIGLEPQSMAFVSTAGSERLCSGMTTATASAAAISPVKRTTLAGRPPSRSMLYIGRSSIRG
jgi:hypothetical protein